MRLTAQDLHAEKIVDKIISEPPGGAHTDYDKAARFLDAALTERLAEAVSCSQEERLTRRYKKLRDFGRWGTAEVSALKRNIVVGDVGRLPPGDAPAAAALSM